MEKIELVGEQAVAYEGILDFFTKPELGDKRVFKAFAGCGKSFVARQAIKHLQFMGKRIAVVAFTGRAASQLGKEGLHATTIHSFLYQPVFNAAGELVDWEPRERNQLLLMCEDGIVIDEASMLPKKLDEDLTAIGVKILYIGDEGQVDPVDPDNPDFNAITLYEDDCVISLLENKRFDVRNGIGFITNHLRTDDSIPRVKKDALTFVKKNDAFTVQFHKDNQFDIIICGMNKTRKKVNDLVRKARGYEGDIPQIGEQVICLQNYALEQEGSEERISNGELFTVLAVYPALKAAKYVLKREDGREFTLTIEHEVWQEEKPPRITKNAPKKPVFGFGWALTTHKAQGSTFSSVLFVDEDVSFFLNRKKVRYTATSRAAEQLTIAI